MKKNKWIVVLGILLVIAGAVVWLYSMKQNPEQQQIRQFQKQIKQTQPEGIGLSMYSLENFDETILADYRGVPTMFLEISLEGKTLVQTLEQILQENAQITTVFLGITSDGSTDGWEEALLHIGTAYPDVTFEILLSFPSIQEWLALSEDALEDALAWYQAVCGLYSHYDIVENVHVFMPACEEWLICNEDNYDEAGNVTKAVAIELEKLIFCDYGCIVVPNTIAEKCDHIRELYQKYQQSEIAYGTRAGDTYVFLGDSVIGNYTGSLSIPGVVSYMTGANVINCGYGGLAAAKADADSVGLEDVLDALLSQDSAALLNLENDNVQQGIRQFWQCADEIQEERLVFFLSFGINDYATGRPVTGKGADSFSYAGALQDAVERLQAAYPKAQIILMTPNYITIFEGGTNVNSEDGAVFTAYVEAVKILAEEKNLPVIDIYEDLGITAENAASYLADGCHPNYLGRFKIGEIVWKSMLLQ